MAIGEDTQLDAPVTPAPIFAYRALKAALWGEPDSPDPNVRSNVSLASKAPENPQPRDVHKSRPAIHLSPSQKRKRTAPSQSSPTKSILRTPGALTPRRAMLRDVTVTFKDLRKSISPELSFKGAITQKPIHTDAQAGKENLFVVSTKQNALNKIDVDHTAAQVTLTNLQPSSIRNTAMPKPQHEITQQPLVLKHNPAETFDVEEYMRTTEKEMKKLIKYGQKMREYARQQDDENNKLRALLEEARQENERLREQIEHPDVAVAGASMKKNNTSKSSQVSSSSRNKEESRPPKPSQTLEAADTAVRGATHKATTTTHDDDDFEPLDLDIIRRRRIPLSTEEREVHTLRTSHKRPPPDLEPEQPEPEPIDSVPPSPRPPPRRPPPSSSSSSRPSPKKPRHGSLDLSIRPPAVDVAVDAAAVLPDRLAAARARVRKKMELRKISTGETAAGAVPGIVVETSQLDWAGL